VAGDRQQEASGSRLASAAAYVELELGVVCGGGGSRLAPAAGIDGEWQHGRGTGSATGDWWARLNRRRN
jgi:hypothetical protein